MLSLDSIKSRISRANSVVIICHVSPDGDALGSGLALRRFLVKLGKKKVELLCADEGYDKIAFLCQDEEVKRDLPDDSSFDLAIGLDVASAERMGDARRFYYRAKDRFVIDHHATNEFDSSELYLVGTASSTAEILYSVLEFVSESTIDKDIAECLYTGILTDSGAFYHRSTTQNTHYVLSKLYAYGIDANTIYYEFFKKIDKNVFKLHSTVMKNAVFENNSQVIIISFRKQDFIDTNTSISDTEGCINKVLDVDGVMVAVAIAEVGENSYKVSFRSKGDVDVAACASRYGGGGHKNAAGCRLNGSYYDVYDKILHVVNNAL